MKKLFNENGHLTEAGKSALCEGLGLEVSVLLAGNQDISELRTLKAVLVKYVSDMVTDHINYVSKVVNNESPKNREE